MSTEITYSTVKEDSIALAMDASAKSTVAGRTVEKNDGAVWNQTVVAVMERIDLTEVSRDTTKEGIKANGAIVKKILADNILASTTIPETGKNRKGQSFTICGKNGLPQWSSWERTRRIWDYAGTIAKVLAFSQENLLYPESLKVGARVEVIKACKVEEGHMDAIKRQSSGLQLSLDSVSNASEALTAHKMVDSLIIPNLDLEAELRALITKLDSKLDLTDSDTKDRLKSDLIAMATKHFSA